jgi:hypothetical protein
MGDILPFKKPKPAPPKKGNTLCKSGFHKWREVGETRFDVKAGKLVTLCRCQRCGATKSELR